MSCDATLSSVSSSLVLQAVQLTDEVPLPPLSELNRAVDAPGEAASSSQLPEASHREGPCRTHRTRIQIEVQVKRITSFRELTSGALRPCSGCFLAVRKKSRAKPQKTSMQSSWKAIPDTCGRDSCQSSSREESNYGFTMM